MITIKQLETELGGEDNLLNALVQLELEAKEEYDDGDPELAAIRRAAANPVVDSPVPKRTTTAKKTAPKSGSAIAKGQQQASQVGSALTTAAREAKKTNKLTNLKQGARQAELDKQDQQLGYLHRMAQLETAGAQVFDEQLTNFNASMRDHVDAEVNIEDVLGGLDVASPLEQLTEQEDFTRLGIPIGITFFV